MKKYLALANNVFEIIKKPKYYSLWIELCFLGTPMTLRKLKDYLSKKRNFKIRKSVLFYALRRLQELDIVHIQVSNNKIFYTSNPSTYYRTDEAIY
jgi:hypothetical protein